VKVLHCIYTLGGGGAERQLAYLAAIQSEEGLETHVAFTKGGVNLRILLDSQVVLHQLPSRAKYDPRMLLDLYRLIKKIRPQFIQTWLTQMDILAGAIAWWIKTPVVLSERSSEKAYPHNARNMLRSLIGCNAIAIAANSKQGCDYWYQRGFKRRLVVIRNGLLLEKIRHTQPCSMLPLGSGLAISSEQKLIMFAGRYGEEKNLEVLIDSFSQVLGRCENVVAVLFGAGPKVEKLKSIRSTLPNRDRLHILDYTNDLWGYMRRAEQFVSLSLFEGSPNVVLEAAASGCALVLSDIPEHREIVDDESAKWVPANDSKAVTEAILQLLSDPDSASKMAQHARERVSSMSVCSAALEYKKLYNQVVLEIN